MSANVLDRKTRAAVLRARCALGVLSTLPTFAVHAELERRIAALESLMTTTGDTP